MRKLFFKKLITLALIFTAGCSAVGVISSSNPYRKLIEAESLTDQNRPPVAETLISEAIEICKEKNDWSCLAYAYRGYGIFLMSESIESSRWREHYARNGFRDSSVNLENRYSKSAEFLETSRRIYLDNGEGDAAINLSLNIGFAHEMSGELLLACQAYDASLKAYEERNEVNPVWKVNLPDKYKSFKDYIEIQKNRALCKN